jgi:hypothetical protein
MTAASPDVDIAEPAARVNRSQSTLPLLVLTLLCLFFSALRWLKTDSFWGDSSRWLFEAWRAASGELPYRDFAWQYPPFSVLLFGGAFRLFGASFATTQIVIDVISTAIVLLTWFAARRVLPPALAVAVAATLGAAGAGNTGNFALFSLQIYTPAVLTGMAGLLLMLEPLFGYIESGKLSRAGRIMLSAGATISFLSKPEYAMGAVGALAVAAVFDMKSLRSMGGTLRQWFGRQAALFALTILPALALYGLLAWEAGPGNLIAGVTGYGMATLVCPYWPTGLGAFGAAVALLQATAILSLLRVLSFRGAQSSPRRTSIALWAAAALAIPATVLYLPYCVRELPVFAGGSSPSRLAGFFLSTGTVLLPVMWGSVVLWFRLALGAAREKALPAGDGILLMLITAAIIMSARTLFGGTLSQLTLVTVAAYPIWFILAPWLVERFLSGSGVYPLARVSAPVVILVGAYGMLRFGAALMTARPAYTDLKTPAGTVRLLDPATSGGIYRYVAEHTSGNEPVLDIAYGGAVNFALRRESPIYSTQFSALAPPQRYLDLDLERFRAHPPKLIIAASQADFEATYGLCAETGCMFPKLVWRPTRLACEPDRKFPVLEFIKLNYAPVARFGEKTIYAAKSM